MIERHAVFKKGLQCRKTAILTSFGLFSTFNAKKTYITAHEILQDIVEHKFI